MAQGPDPAQFYCFDRPYLNRTMGGEAFAYIRLCLDIGILSTTFIVNLVLMAAILLHRRHHRGSLKTLNSSVSMKFVLNLAFSDILVTLTVPLYLVPHYLCDINDVFRSSQDLCMLKYFATCFSAFSSNMSLIVIAVDRYIAVVHTLRYRVIMTTRLCYIIISSVHLTSLILSAVLFVWNYWEPGTYCDVEDVLPHVYVLVLGSVLHTAILSVVFVTHWRLHKQAQQSASRRDIIHSSLSLPSRSTGKSARVVLLVTGVYFLCWTPYSIVLMIRIVQPPSSFSARVDFAFQLTVVFSFINSALNPFIYAWKNSEIQSAVKWFCLKYMCRNTKK